MTVRYQLASLFSIRVAGVPYEPLERTVTRATAVAARHVLERQGEVERSALAVAAALPGLPQPMARSRADRIRRDLLLHRPLPPEVAQTAPELADYARAQQAHLAACQALEHTLQEELVAVQREVLAVLPELGRFSVFCSTSVQGLIDYVADAQGEGLSEDARGRKRERTLLHYLQRVATKNDTFSEFGPGGWGRVDPQRCGLSLDPRPGIARRLTYLEKWVTEQVIRVMNHDPDVRPEVAPRLHPSARLEESTLVREDTGVRLELGTQALATLRCCDGRTPAHALPAPELLGYLAQNGAIIWALEVMSLDPHRFDRLIEDVHAWRLGATRDRWLARLEQIARIPREFERQTDPIARRKLMAQARAEIQDCGGTIREDKRTLYRASNPISEECHRECNLTIGGDIAGHLAADVAPWLDLWRDVIAYVCFHVNAYLVSLYEKADGSARRSLACFLRHCEGAGLSLAGDGYSNFIRQQYKRVQLAFRERLSPPACAEWVLTRKDCEFVRSLPDYRRWQGAAAWPAVDLQLAARSLAAIDRGDYRWVIGELNVPRVLLTQARYWSCPDPAQLQKILQQATHEERLCQWSPWMEDRVSHVTAHWPAVFADRWTALGSERMRPEHPWLAPVDATPYINETTGELRIREARSGRDLGSFVAPWNFQMAIGTHPFVFPRPPYIPRLRLGRVVVQRRCWVLTASELPGGPFSGISSELVLGVERLRASKDWPRWVFIRPTDDVLLRFHAEGRDKDVKPAYIDLESYPFLAMLARTLTKYGEIEITEMLPDPDELCWHEPNGRRTFELRGQFLPVSESGLGSSD